jgi:quercetin dioxygenase-like cupin family protein
MKIAFPVLVMSAVNLAVAAPPVNAQSVGEHRVVSPHEIKWAAAPQSIPPGAEAAVLYGDPAKEGPFAMRLKLPKGYKIAPHSHPKPEIVTVISGTFRLGMGEKAEESKAKALPPGSFFAMPPGMAHFASADEDTVVQLNTSGPWSLTYVNAQDDPRKK